MKLFKKSRIVKEILKDVYDNPESWNRLDGCSIHKGPIKIRCLSTIFLSLDIDDIMFQCTFGDEFTLRRSVVWWMSEAPLVNLRIK